MSVLKILENFVTIFRLASVIPVILPVTTVRMPLRNQIITIFKISRFTGTFSLVLRIFAFVQINGFDAVGVVGAPTCCAVIAFHFTITLWPIHGISCHATAAKIAGVPVAFSNSNITLGSGDILPFIIDAVSIG